MKDNCTTISVSFGSDQQTATVRFSGRSRPVIATILGVERDTNGEINKIFFNSLFHIDSKESNYSGWLPSGCISTILRRDRGV